jgi:hypothetical protein
MTMNNCSSSYHQTVSGGKWWSVASVATTTLLRYFEVSFLDRNGSGQAGLYQILNPKTYTQVILI